MGRGEIRKSWDGANAGIVGRGGRRNRGTDRAQKMVGWDERRKPWDGANAGEGVELELGVGSLTFHGTDLLDMTGRPFSHKRK